MELAQDRVQWQAVILEMLNLEVPVLYLINYSDVCSTVIKEIQCRQFPN
jgi:hypothetical protein